MGNPSNKNSLIHKFLIKLNIEKTGSLSYLNFNHTNMMRKYFSVCFVKTYTPIFIRMGQYYA